MLFETSQIPDRSRGMQLTAELQEYLHSTGKFESESQTERRRTIILKVESIFSDWIKETTKSRVRPLTHTHICGKVFPCGSYQLNVHTKESDLDLLGVAPVSVNYSDFFKSFYYTLKKHPDVSEIHPIESNVAPLMRFKYEDITIDMHFAQIWHPTVREDMDLHQLLVDKDFRMKPIQYQYSVNSLLVANALLSSVGNIENFRTTLKAVRLWAKNRIVCSNVCGTLSNVSWAILVGRICQLHPEESSAALLTRFFHHYLTWNWPDPVFMDTSEPLPYRNPNVLEERKSEMPIITPAVPEYNSANNVTNLTKPVIMEELERAHDITSRVNEGNASWDELFRPLEFFSHFDQYLGVICMAGSELESRIVCGLVQSRFPFLLEEMGKTGKFTKCHINPKSFIPKDPQLLSIATEGIPPAVWFMGIQPKDGESANIELELQAMRHRVLQTSNKRRLITNIDKVAVAGTIIGKSDLEKWLDPQDINPATMRASEPILSRPVSLSTASLKTPVVQSNHSFSTCASKFIFRNHRFLSKLYKFRC